MRKSPSLESFQCNTIQEPSKTTTCEQLNFIQKAYQLVNNPNNSEIIHWSRSGLTFIIENIERFEKDILPLYFRHNRYQSFVRQLNMYDFHKIRNGDYYCQNKSQFRHEQFTRGNIEIILKIKRKGFQVRNKQKKNTKIKKCYKINSKKTIKRKKIIQNQNILQKNVIQNQNILQKNELSVPFIVQEQNSFFNQLSVNLQQIQLKHINKIQTVQKQIEDMVTSIMQILHKNNLYAQKRNKIKQIIDLAELIKEKWLSISVINCQSENIKVMKDVYYRVKQQINQQFIYLSVCEKSQKGKIQQKQKNIQFEFLQTISQEQAIIDSILRTQIRSTLICINSETLLNHGYAIRKIDTFIGM